MQMYYSAMPQSSPKHCHFHYPHSLTLPISLRGPKKTLIFFRGFKTWN